MKRNRFSPPTPKERLELRKKAKEERAGFRKKAKVFKPEKRIDRFFWDKVYGGSTTIPWDVEEKELIDASKISAYDEPKSPIEDWAEKWVKDNE